jgi:hypothetical protein
MSSLIKTGSAPAHVKKKRGRNELNEEEKKFINEHKGKIPQAVIAKRLGRGYSTINKFCNGKVYVKKKGFFDFDSFVF